MKYSDKLRDPRWQKKRLEIFNRDNFSCTNCGDSTKELHIHHEKYIGEPWEAPNELLKTLCDKCHKGEHSLEPTLEELEIQCLRFRERIKEGGSRDAIATWHIGLSFMENEIKRIYG